MDEVERGEHLDATSEITLDVVKKRAVSGVLALTGRNVFLQIIGFVATFLLTVFLAPAQFGIFFVVSAAVNFFGYFSDIGLGAALIQKKDRLVSKDLETTFTVQNSLVLILLVIIFLSTPFFQQWQHLDQEAIYLLWALAISLLLSSLKSIPSLLLERELNFNKYIIPQMAEQVIYYVVVVFLAWKGWGITSFTIAVLARGVSGLVLMYAIRPWKPGLALSVDSLKGLLRFGLPYQINTFLAVAKDDLMTIVLGGIIGPANMGLLGWAQKYATYPLRFIMDPAIKVTFPAYARMQEYKEELSSAVSKSVLFICVLVFPALAALVVMAPVLVDLIPKYDKWQPALLALTLIAINSAWAAVTTPLTNVLTATGRIKTTFYLMIMWTVLTWIFVPGLSYFYGLNGAALGYALVGSSSVIAILIALRSVRFNLVESVGKPLAGAVIMGGVLLAGQKLLSLSWVNVILIVVTALAVYIVSVLFLVGPALMQDVKKVALSFKGKV